MSDIDEVLLIGGATRLSVVRDFLIRLFRKFPDTAGREPFRQKQSVPGRPEKRNGSLYYGI